LWEMLSRFVSLKNCILKAMIDIKCSVQLSDAEIETIQEIVSTLEPIKLAVEALCRRDINLVSADAVVKFAVVTLEKQTSKLARTLAPAVRTRIAERRNDFAGTLLYLNNPNVASNDDTFSIPKTSTIRSVIQSLILRLDHPESADVQDVSATSSNNPILKSTNADDGEDMPLARELSLREQMMKDSLSSVTCGVQGRVQGHLTDVGRTITNALEAEMQLYTSTGNRGTCLEKVHAYLMSIPATTVEAKRAAAGVLCTKLRSQLADNSIDTMCFLRSYYMKRRTCN